MFTRHEVYDLMLIFRMMACHLFCRVCAAAGRCLRLRHLAAAIDFRAVDAITP